MISLTVNVSDTTKQVMEMIEYDRQAKALFFVIDKADGKQCVAFLCYPHYRC